MTDVSLNRPLTVFYFNYFYYWQESGYTNYSITIYTNFTKIQNSKDLRQQRFEII